jgi:hypothetical protein
MKRILCSMVLAVLSLLGSRASAAPCAVGTLADYTSLGAAGCTIGNVTFTSFGLLTTPTAASNFSVVLTPYLVGGNVGFEFTSSATADATLLDDVIGYRATGTALSFTGADLALIGSEASGDGSVTAINNFCFSGSYSGALLCSSGMEGPALLTLGGFQDTDGAAFAGLFTSIGIATDLGLDGGSDFSASLGTARSTLRFVPTVTAVPEPTTYALLVIGAVALLARRRRVDSPRIAFA